MRGPVGSALERATARFRDDEGMDDFRAHIGKWHKSLDEQRKQWLRGNLTPEDVLRFVASVVVWEGTRAGVTQEEVDNFARAFCPSFKQSM